LWVENNGTFMRGKTKARQDIENVHLSRYALRKPGGWQYEPTVQYDADADLGEQVEEIMAWTMADLHLPDRRTRPRASAPESMKKRGQG